MNPRETKGQELIQKGIEPKPIMEDAYSIPSQSSDKKYKVINHYNGWLCTCPDYHYRKVQCKHIFAIRYWLDMRSYLNKEGVFEALEVMYDKPSCTLCNSFKVIRNGIRKNKGMDKQRFKCLNCEKTFIQNPEFKGYKADAKVVTCVMDLYFKGISLRKIQDHLIQFYDLKVSHETIRFWINKFMRIIREYTDQIKVPTSRHWNVDEMKIKAGGNWVWNWNVMDKETRFLLASNVTKTRYIKDARKVFSKAKDTTPFQPRTITTDGLQSYKRAVVKEFHTLKNRNTKHIGKAGIAKRQNNNIVERLNGSMRERIKVQRGYQNADTSQVQIENWRTYYNFVRPHMALAGKTPAEESLVKIPLGRNKWDSLIRRANDR